MIDSEDGLYDSEVATSDYYEDGDEDNNEDLKDMETYEKNYTILSEADIRQHQAEHIDTLSSALSIPKEAASVLLRHYRWNTSDVHTTWFSDEEKVRKSLGLLLNKSDIIRYPDVNNTGLNIKCRICYDEKHADEFTSTDYCDHVFCVECWKQYVTTSIDDGPGCLTLRCPDPKCQSAVPHDMINVFVTDAYKDKYLRFLVDSYVEGDPNIKWCPRPRCEYAVKLHGFGVAHEGPKSYDVRCQCSSGFCWNCMEDAHRPVDCDTVANWMTKCKAEADNTAWILTYTKPCPKCNRSIEKNKGCMHMICGSHCRYEFCWLCLGPWSGHKGFYECNRYEKANQDGKIDEEGRKNAKNIQIRYMHYYERWAANDKSRTKALDYLQKMEIANLDKLSELLSEPNVKKLDFIKEAFVQIAECRQVLKWTYAYGYFLPENGYINKKKKQLFEYLQGQAEAGLERLHYFAEKVLGEYLYSEYEPSDSFKDFRIKLIDLTKVTGFYFQNLVNALEDNLSEVNSR